MKTRQSGFSLIELMVAMVLGILVVIGATQVYIGTRQTNRVQEMQARLTEDGRFALSMLQRLISQAGYRAPNEPLPNDRIVPDATTPATKFVLKAKGDNSNIVGCDGTKITDTTNFSALEIKRDGSKLSCGSVEWIAPQTGGRGTEVIDFQVQYGYDNAVAPSDLADEYRCGGAGVDRDCIADAYATSLPSGVTNEQIVAVQVCLVLRTEMLDAGISKAGAVKDCSDSAISGSDTDKKLYRQFRSTVLLKNR